MDKTSVNLELTYWSCGIGILTILTSTALGLTIGLSDIGYKSHFITALVTLSMIQLLFLWKITAHRNWARRGFIIMVILCAPFSFLTLVAPSFSHIVYSGFTWLNSFLRVLLITHMLGAWAFTACLFFPEARSLFSSISPTRLFRGGLYMSITIAIAFSMLLWLVAFGLGINLTVHEGFIIPTQRAIYILNERSENLHHEAAIQTGIQWPSWGALLETVQKKDFAGAVFLNWKPLEGLYAFETPVNKKVDLIQGVDIIAQDLEMRAKQSASRSSMPDRQEHPYSVGPLTVQTLSQKWVSLHGSPIRIQQLQISGRKDKMFRAIEATFDGGERAVSVVDMSFLYLRYPQESRVMDFVEQLLNSSVTKAPELKEK